MNQKLKIIIAAHTFPPTPGIGGRRWAKLAKYLVRKGHSVEVVSARQSKIAGSPWERDVQGIDQYHYAHKFPEILTKSPNTVGEKLNYRLALRKMRKASKGTPYDRALLDQLPFLDTLEQRIKSFKPDAVIATGAPFRLLHYTGKLRDKYPSVKFIADFRDPWTWGETFGYKSLPETRLNVEQKLEAEVCEKFDLILSPWPEIIAKLKSSHAQNASKMYVLSHGFDADDIVMGSVAIPQSGQKKTLLYGGTIYEEFIPQLEAIGQQGGNDFEVHVYTAENKSISAIRGIKVFDPLPASQFFQNAKEADWLLFPIPERLKNGVPTKLYEFAALSTPLLAFGSEGLVSNFIQEKRLGCYLSDLNRLEEIINTGFDTPHNPNWLQEYTISFITDQLLDLISKRS